MINFISARYIPPFSGIVGVRSGSSWTCVNPFWKVNRYQDHEVCEETDGCLSTPSGAQDFLPREPWNDLNDFKRLADRPGRPSSAAKFNFSFRASQSSSFEAHKQSKNDLLWLMRAFESGGEDGENIQSDCFDRFASTFLCASYIDQNHLLSRKQS